MDLAKDLIRLSGFTDEQIPIVVTGLRPGEKIEEALWEDGSDVRTTLHQDVFQVIEQENRRAADTATLVDGLQRAVEHGNRFAMESIIREWIPGFVPTSTGPKPRRDVVSIASARANVAR
jgi:FlaA1/EpsC-like NDP-sugar epimerase